MRGNRANRGKDKKKLIPFQLTAYLRDKGCVIRKDRAYKLATRHAEASRYSTTQFARPCG